MRLRIAEFLRAYASKKLLAALGFGAFLGGCEKVKDTPLTGHPVYGAPITLPDAPVDAGVLRRPDGGLTAETRAAHSRPRKTPAKR
jgi:hypothetical protein